jgi:signal transduction histidine kinase
VQHAGARIVKVTVRQESGRILLEIQDDGKGFNAREERGMGLLGIEERVSYLGGTFLVESEPGRGATLSVALPVRSGVAQPVQVFS